MFGYTAEEMIAHRSAASSHWIANPRKIRARVDTLRPTCRSFKPFERRGKGIRIGLSDCFAVFDNDGKRHRCRRKLRVTSPIENGRKQQAARMAERDAFTGTGDATLTNSLDLRGNAANP